MWSRRHTSLSLFLCVLALTVLFGCRAFQPEVVIVNKPPQTYIMGAPAETSGGYFHFHVYWYGTDLDGNVERFVWALSDTSVQDLETDDDEEDSRFNPALNISTLQIGHWTDRTDTIFDFAIRQGANLAYDMTLHMVAVDDRGDFDRTPARLHFISNALGNPQLTFWKETDGGPPQVFADFDTIPYGLPFKLSWSATTPNIRSYAPELLAERDTVGPVDGLYGFKFRVLDEVCDESRLDCWKPRYWDDARGDSISFFGNVIKLDFANDQSGADVFRRRLGSGPHQVLVNTIDVAGVEVPLSKQDLNIIINHDPQTRLLVGEQDPIYTSDPHIYPYFKVYYPNPGDPENPIVEEYPFAAGDTVPDRAVVVFKALGKDHPADLKLRTERDYDVRFQGAFSATGLFNGQSPFPFGTQYSQLHRTEEWEPGVPDAWSADTVSFVAGPFRYRFLMRSEDEHGRRDGTPDTLRFYGNYPPCVQRVEVLNYTEFSSYPADADCYDPVYADVVDTLFAARLPQPGMHMATLVSNFGFLWYNMTTGDVSIEQPLQPEGYLPAPGMIFGYKLWLHGKDHPREPPRDPQDRIMSWRYEVRYENDPFNIIRDGGGIDNLASPTYNFSITDPSYPVYVDNSGVWILAVQFFVPNGLIFSGSGAYYEQLLDQFGGNPDQAQRAFDLTTIFLGRATVTVVARDATACGPAAAPVHPRQDKGKYHYYKLLRTPRVVSNGRPIGRHCEETFNDDVNEPPLYEDIGQLELDDFAFQSERYTKNFALRVVVTDLFSGEIIEIFP